MKRVLKDQKTGLYLKSMDEWTANVHEAGSFRDTFEALKFCDEHHLAEVSVLSIARDGSERLVAFRRVAAKPAALEIMPEIIPMIESPKPESFNSAEVA